MGEDGDTLTIVVCTVIALGVFFGTMVLLHFSKGLGQ